MPLFSIWTLRKTPSTPPATRPAAFNTKQLNIPGTTFPARRESAEKENVSSLVDENHSNSEDSVTERRIIL